MIRQDLAKTGVVDVEKDPPLLVTDQPVLPTPLNIAARCVSRNAVRRTPPTLSFSLSVLRGPLEGGWALSAAKASTPTNLLLRTGFPNLVGRVSQCNP